MDVSTVIQRLKEIVGARYVLTSDPDLMLYGYDAYLETSKPDVVVLPENTEEVSRIALLAYEAGVPVTARGAGTCLSGGPVPLKGGIVIHFSRMNRILEIDAPNKRARVEPGVITLDLQTAVAKKGPAICARPGKSKDFHFGRECRRELRRTALP